MPSDTDILLLIYIGLLLFRQSSGKLSSKQIGEEITVNEKAANKNLECGTGDFCRFWPLLCFELSLSVDQEEKFRSRYLDFR